MKRELQYGEKIQPRTIGRKDVSALMGKAFAAGMATFHTRQMNNAIGSAVPGATELIDEALHEFTARNVTFDGLAQLMVPTVHARVEKALNKVIAAAPVPRDWPVLAVERSYPKYGNMRPDLVVTSDTGVPMVIDYKLKITLDARYRLMEEVKYARSWQMFHYAYFIAQEYEVPATEYGIVLTVLEPKFATELLRYPIKPEAMEQWHVFAEHTWDRMTRTDASDASPEGQTNCRDQYGPCPYTAWCWEFFGDENLASHLYEKGATR